MAALGRSWVDHANIEVTAHGGKMTLSGKVNSWHELDQASATAWTAPGTTSVDNEIAVL